MKRYGKILLLLSVSLIAVTHFSRSGDHGTVASSVNEASRDLSAVLDPTLIKISPTRTTSSQLYCVGKSRTDLITAADRETAKSYFTTMDSYFKVDAMSILSKATSGDTTAIMTAAQPAITGFGIYVIPFAIGLLLSLTLWLCLCCCCTCPGCCPSKCCQHDENLMYTKCELLWPAITMMLLMLLAVAACVPGITRSSTLGDSFQTMQCGVALTMDDILNGNINSDKTSFFAGVKTFNV